MNLNKLRTSLSVMIKRNKSKRTKKLFFISPFFHGKIPEDSSDNEWPIT